METSKEKVLEAAQAIKKKIKSIFNVEAVDVKEVGRKGGVLIDKETNAPFLTCRSGEYTIDSLSEKAEFIADCFIDKLRESGASDGDRVLMLMDLWFYIKEDKTEYWFDFCIPQKSSES